MTSLSTKFFGQPRLTNPTFLIALEGLELGLSEIAGEISGQASTGMQSFNFTIPGWQAPPGNSFLLRGGFHFAVQLRQLFSVFWRMVFRNSWEVCAGFFRIPRFDRSLSTRVYQMVAAVCGSSIGFFAILNRRSTRKPLGPSNKSME